MAGDPGEVVVDTMGGSPVVLVVDGCTMGVEVDVEVGAGTGVVDELVDHVDDA